MAQPQLYKIIGIPILISLIITGLILFLSSASTKYDLEGYDNTTLNEIKASGEAFDNVVDNFDAETTDLSSNEAEADKEGNIISQVISAFKTVSGSYTLYDSLLDSSLDKMHLGPYSGVIKGTLVSLIVLVLVLGIGMTIYLRTNV